MDHSHIKVFTDIPNVGKATAGDFRMLGLEKPAELAGQDPYELYNRLCKITQQRHDPCVLDVFIAAIRFMQGESPRKWWEYTAERKAALRQQMQGKEGEDMNRTVLITTTIMTALILSSCSSSSSADLAGYFKDFEGTIVILNEATGETIIHNPARASQPLSPFSTFKIPNSLIALENRIVPDCDTPLVWDSLSYPAEDWWPAEWRKSNDLRSALKFSVVPLYRDIARKIGEPVMRQMVNRFDYGNKDISSGLDSFWLNGSMQISARQQIDFLRRFYNEELGLSRETTAQVKDILMRTERRKWRLSAKTGGGTLDRAESPALGWFVGYVERDDNVYYFALNISGDSFEQILQPRFDITYDCLRAVGIID